ncbi:MAG: ECF transporter S component [Deltaproteobacteria bacterium]|nr:ECF transporter S component [Deltaproteobacteria bacterium]
MKIKEFAILSLFIALTAVATMIVRIPIPQTTGYMNLGDTMVLLSGTFFGPIPGFIAGGVGSALADLIGGYPQWALWTLVIKGIEATLVGWLVILMRLKKKQPSILVALCYIFAVAWMVLGYFIAETIMYDQKAALAELPMNLLQAGGSVLLASLLLPVFNRIIKDVRSSPDSD